MNREEFLRQKIEEKFSNVKRFSEIIGLPYTTVRTILEKGVGNARVDNVFKICEGLGVNPEELASIEEKPNTHQRKINYLNTEKLTSVEEKPNVYLKETNYLNTVEGIVDFALKELNRTSLTLDDKPLGMNAKQSLTNTLLVGLELAKKINNGDS